MSSLFFLPQEKSIVCPEKLSFLHYNKYKYVFHQTGKDTTYGKENSGLY